MADQPKDPGYNTQIDRTFVDEAKKVEPHKGENKTTRSTEGKVETTTREKK